MPSAPLESSPFRPPRNPWRYGIALLAPFVALIAQMALYRTLGQYLPLLIMLLAITAVAFRFGQRAALVSVAIGAGITFFAVGRIDVFPPTTGQGGNTTRILFFVLAGGAISTMVGALHRAQAFQRELAGRAQRDAETLRDREGLLRSIADHSSDIVFAKDRAGRFVFMNAAGYRVSGLTQEQVIGRSDPEIHGHAGQVEAYVSTDQRVMSTGVPESTEEPYTSPTTGEQRLFFSTKTPQVDGAGKVIGIVGVVQDITERRAAADALRASEERLRLAAQAGGFGTYSRDFAGGPRWWSDELKSLAGLASTDAVPDDYPERLLHAEDRARVVALRRLWFSAHGPEAYEDEHRWVLPDGTVRWVLVKGCTIHAGEGSERRVVRSMGAVLDISSRKASEEELRESNSAAEAARLSAERAKESAEAASRSKDDFLAALSHELRNPLNPVLLLASAWEGDPAVPEAQREDWSMVRKNIALEARLIDDLLDLTSIARGKLSVSVAEIDAHSILHEALEIIRADLERKRIVLTLDLAAANRLVWADAVRLQQIFWNILKNAVKFTSETGSVTVSTRDSEGSLLLEVMDSGIGMSREEIAVVFDAFSQGEHAEAGGAHRFGGLGLGLAITKQLVQMHGGRIWAISPGRGCGATFSVELPLIKSPGLAPKSPDSSDRLPPPAAVENVAPRSRKLLLVEDHEATRSTLTRLLSRRGYDVSSAGSLAEARSIAATGRFEILVSDLGLPDGSGHTLLGELQRSQGASLRGIALSGYGMQEDVTRSREAGFDEHLTKPVEIQELVQALQRLHA